MILSVLHKMPGPVLYLTEVNTVADCSTAQYVLPGNAVHYSYQTPVLQYTKTKVPSTYADASQQ